MKTSSIIVNVFAFTALIMLSGCASEIQIDNNGSKIAEVMSKNISGKILLGQGGSCTRSSETKIRSGNTVFEYDGTLKITNNGSNIARIEYINDSGTMDTLLVGPNAHAYVPEFILSEINGLNIRQCN